MKILKKLFEKEDIISKDEIFKRENEIEKEKKHKPNLQDQLIGNYISPEENTPQC